MSPTRDDLPIRQRKRIYEEFKTYGYYRFANPEIRDQIEDILSEFKPVFIDGLGMFSVGTVACKKELVPNFRRELVRRIEALQAFLEKSNVGLAELDQKVHVYLCEPGKCNLLNWGVQHEVNGRLACPRCGAPARLEPSPFGDLAKRKTIYVHDEGG